MEHPRGGGSRAGRQCLSFMVVQFPYRARCSAREGRARRPLEYTPYKAFGYNPAVGQFYTQTWNNYGGYPWIDAFAVLKWKRMRIFTKFEHVSQDLLGRRDYFMVAHYPLNKRIFKFGVSWSWYD